MRCKITVLKRALHPEMAEQYSDLKITLCPYFEEGQQFLCNMFEKPAGFCDWAWQDINRILVALDRGGNFNTGAFTQWMKNDRSMIACCTDGIRPVSFLLERIED